MSDLQLHMLVSYAAWVALTVAIFVALHALVGFIKSLAQYPRSAIFAIAFVTAVLLVFARTQGWL